MWGLFFCEEGKKKKSIKLGDGGKVGPTGLFKIFNNRIKWPRERRRGRKKRQIALVEFGNALGNGLFRICM